MFVAAMIAMIACKKEIHDMRSKTCEPDGAFKAGDPPQDCAMNVSIECGMLSFEDLDHFLAVAECLTERYNAHVDWFVSQNENLDDDELDELAEVSGFVDEEAIIYFETSLGFASYRQHYESTLTDWVDAGNDPEDFSMPELFPSPALAALRNVHGAVMIGGAIYLTDGSGRRWEFCTCDVHLDYLANPTAYESIEGDPCVTLHRTIYEGNGTQCSDSWRQCRWIEYSTGKKVKATLEFSYGGYAPTQTLVSARLDAWKQRASGRWKRRYLSLHPRATGPFTETGCDARGNYNVNKGSKRRRTWESWDSYHGQKTFKNETCVGSYVWGPNNLQHTIMLDFVNGQLCWN
ncbi:MAG: hypothetical protein WAT74_12665 [Flavobacteriales bacterium]